MLLRIANQEAGRKGGILIYPGFGNDFVSFPLSSQAANIYREIQGGTAHTVSIFPEGGNSIKVEDVLYVAQKLEENTSIHEFSIRDFSIGDQGFKLFAKILQNNTYLTTLELENTEPTDEGVTDLSSALERNKTVTDLNIKRNLAVGRQIEAIARLLTINKVLKRLDVGYIGLTQKNAELLKKIFTGKEPKNTTLIWINLDGNDIGGSAGKILNRLKRNKKLVH